MIRRTLTACLTLLGLVAGVGAEARAQVGFPRDVVPSRSALDRLGLERSWFTAVPLGTPRERVIAVSMAEDLVFAQTNSGNFFVFDSETGRLRWAANLGDATLEAHHASVNSFGVFVANGFNLIALDRRSGNVLWRKPLGSLSTSDTAASEERVYVGLDNGKLLGFRSRDIKQAKGASKNYTETGGSIAYTWQTNAKVTSRPIPAEQVFAFASNDGKVYVAVDKPSTLLYRWPSGGPIVAPMATHGTRMLLAPSMDNSLYALDLYNGDLLWAFPSGAPISREPLVGDDDLYFVNTKGAMSALNVMDGKPRWTLPSGASRLLAVGQKRVYALSADNDLIIIDRSTGKILFDARATAQRAGLNLRDFTISPTNAQNDRMYFSTPSGLLIGVREAGAVQPRPIRKPGAKPFGYIPPEGVPSTPPPAPDADAEKPDAEKPEADKPAMEKPEVTEPVAVAKPPAARPPVAEPDGGAAVPAFTQADLKFMKGLKSKIGGPPPVVQGLDLAGVMALPKLNLSMVDLKDADLAHIKGLSELKELDLSYNPLTDKGLVHIKGLTGLEELSLNSMNITDAGLAHLAGLANLEQLSLIDAKITDKGMAQLTALKNLQGLAIPGTSIGDAGLANLAGMPKLRSIFVLQTKVTAKGAEEFNKTMPNTRVDLGKPSK